MTPKPETQGETYAELLNRLQLRHAQAPLSGWEPMREMHISGFDDAMRLIEWQAARIEELRAAAHLGAGFIEGYSGDAQKAIVKRMDKALAASAPDAAVAKTVIEAKS